MYSLACSGLNSRRKKGEYEGQKSAARSHIVYIGAITHMRKLCRSNNKLFDFTKIVLASIEGEIAKTYTVEPRIADTPEMRTPRLCGHFLKSQRLALFYLYKLPLKCGHPVIAYCRRYRVLQSCIGRCTGQCPVHRPIQLCIYPHPIIRTF